MTALHGMWGELAGVLSAVSAAVGSLQVRALGQNVNPFMINAVRCLLAAIGFALMWSLGSRAVGDWYTAIPLLLFGVICGLIIGDSLYFSAIVRIGSGRATPIAMSYPLPTAFLAYLLFGEELSTQKMLGIVIGVAAIWLIATRQGNRISNLNIDRSNLVGVGLACTASLCWSLSILALRPALALVPVDFANLARMIFAALILGFLSLRMTDSSRQIVSLSRSLGLVAGLGLTAVMTSYFLAESIHHAGASVAALMGSMTPVFAAPLAWLIFDEGISVRLLVAIGLGILGITMVAFSS